MRNAKSLFALVLPVVSIVAPASAVLTGGDLTSPDVHAVDPGNGSPWNYSGQEGGVLGTAIAPHYFVSAAHIGIGVGDAFRYGGQTFHTVASYDTPGSDLRIWKVDGDLGSYAPLETSTDTAGKPLFIIGRGTDRGADIRSADGTLVGWTWGADHGTQRWGTNVAGPTVTDMPGEGPLLTATFHGTADDATVTSGDSGGGVFVNDGGTWKLAGVNYMVENAATVDGQTRYGAIIGNPMYASSIAGNVAWIDSVIGSDLGAVAQTSVPEPASIGLLAVAGAGLLARRR